MGLAQRISPARWHLDGSQAVALTFDDGPDPVYTPPVLDLLAAAGVRATFFLVGQKAEANPGLVQQIGASGHAVGSHSVTHPDPFSAGLRELTDEYRGGRAMVEAALGRGTRLFRAPMGHVPVRGAIAQRRAGVDNWLWSVDPEDWRPDRDPAELAEFVLSRLRPGDVVLLHDGIASPVSERCHDRSATVAALSLLLPEIAGRGLPVVSLTERGAAGQVDAA
jgi:chitooligosaccharide deacetylase